MSFKTRQEHLATDTASLGMVSQKEVFPYCPAWVLSWHYRKQVLLMELRRYNADILCLQARPESWQRSGPGVVSVSIRYML